MRILLERMDLSNEGTFGRLFFGDQTLYTGELPWRDNENDISCVPIGIYTCNWTYSPRFKRHMYLIDNVPRRTGVRIHSANFVGDKRMGFKCQLLGCITLGEKLGWIDNQKAVLISKPAIRKFETHMGQQPFELEIRYGRG